MLRGFIALFLAFLLAACGGGGGSPAANSAPAANLLASGDIRTDAGQLHASVGGTVRLDASTSSDPEQDALSFAWTVLAKPASSKLAAGGTASTIAWQPDALGNYSFELKVTDARGASATQQVTIVVDNTAPTANVITAVQFQPVPVGAPTKGATVGADIIVDANGTTDPDGDAVTVGFTLVSKPAGSAASLAVAGRTARFTADAPGSYQVRVQGTDTSGASFQTTYTFDAQNRAPTAVLVASVGAVTLNAGQSAVTASVGYDVLLDGSASSDADGDAITRAWSLSSRPAGSQATLSASAGNSTTLSPDVLGDYVVVQTVTDGHGAQSTYTTTVHANNRRPVAVITSNATPQSLPYAPTVLVPANTEITLRGDASTDADGDTLAYAWSVDSRPAGSTAALSSTATMAPKITVDAEGAYVFRLRVSDPQGAFSDRTITVQVGTHAPVAVVDRSQASTVVGTAVQASAALSYHEDGDTLSYQWSIDARPSGSTASIASANASGVSFVPDVAGTYLLAVRVSDGRSASIAYVAVQALGQLRASTNLAFVPEIVKYSKGQDRLVIASFNPNALRVVDPFAGTATAVALPAAATRLNLSPDGKLAVVLHSGSFSLVDLQTLTVVRTTASQGAQTDAYVTNAGMVYLTGGPNALWTEMVFVFNGRTGDRLTQPSFNNALLLSGMQAGGVLAPSLNKVFTTWSGSPTDLVHFDIDTATSLVNGAGDSPYHGDYSMQNPLFLSDDDGLLFTFLGNYFRTGDLHYAGILDGMARGMLGISHRTAAQEAIALPGAISSASSYPYPPDYPAFYKRYTGSLLLPQQDVPLPLVGGLQSYGRNIFHSANGSHVLIVQTGSAAQNAAGASYYVIVR